MHIYNLDDSSFFTHDVEEILDRISELYDINFKVEPFGFTSKMTYDKDIFWASPESAERFNKMVPIVKSIAKDMYSIIESLHVSMNGKFDKPNAETKYKNLKELRLLNNKLKHFKTKEIEIALISVHYIDDSIMDFMVQYKKGDDINLINLGDLVRTFLLIIEELNVITIDRSTKKVEL